MAAYLRVTASLIGSLESMKISVVLTSICQSNATSIKIFTCKRWVYSLTIIKFLLDSAHKNPFLTDETQSVKGRRMVAVFKQAWGLSKIQGMRTFPEVQKAGKGCNIETTCRGRATTKKVQCFWKY